MERRSWLWKKKSSDKVAAAPDACDPSNDENNCPKPVPEPMAVSIPDGLQLDEAVKLLSERLAAAQCEVSEKDAVAKQHMKVAEEAVTGWEKSELEAATLKKQLEEALEKKVALEDRVAHLDNALKECVRQLRLVREEQEERLHDTIARKTREWESLRSGLEGELVELRSQLTQSGAHANAVSKSLQERTMTILELNDCKVRAEMDARGTRAKLESIEKEYATLKYDLQVLQRELEIRNEEREYSQKMVEASNRQQIETVKKTSRLEAECQRLRMLLKKKLPGPGALAQMRVEAEPGGESRRRSIPKPGKYCSEPADESNLDDKENDLSLERLRAMEEETSLLKEILAKKNEELQDSRLQCAKTASKLSQLEEQARVRAKPDDVAGDKLLESTSFDLMEDFIEMERLAANNDKEHVKRDPRLEAALRAKEKEVRQANDVCAELRTKLAVAEKTLKSCHCRSATDGSLGKIQETVDLMFGFKSCKEKLSDTTIDAESKARLRSSVGRIIHLVESMAQECSTISSPEMSSHGSDGGVKRLVAVSKNLLQGEVPVLDFIAELSCALDFVVGMSGLHSGGRLESPSSSEQSRRSAPDHHVQEIHHLRTELAELESNLKSSTDTVKSLKIQLATVDEERCLLQRQLASAQDERKVLQSEVGAVTALKNKLESRVHIADAEIRQVRQDGARLAAELREEQRRHQEVALKLQMLQQIPRYDESITRQKEQELVSAGEKLAECQRTIHALGKQLESLGLPPSSSSHATPSRHFSRASELPSINMETSDYIHKQETYWSSEGTPGFASRHQPGMISYSGPQPEEIPLEVRTPARYYRKCKAAAAAAAKSYGNHGELSKSADMSSHSSDKHGGGGGVLGLGKFFSRAKANH